MHNHNRLSLFHISRAYLSNSTATHRHSHPAAVFLNTIVSIQAAVLCSLSTYPSPPSLRRFTSFISFISFIVSSACLSQKSHQPPPLPPASGPPVYSTSMAIYWSIKMSCSDVDCGNGGLILINFVTKIEIADSAFLMSEMNVMMWRPALCIVLATWHCIGHSSKISLVCYHIGDMWGNVHVTEDWVLLHLIRSQTLSAPTSLR